MKTYKHLEFRELQRRVFISTDTESGAPGRFYGHLTRVPSEQTIIAYVYQGATQADRKSLRGMAAAFAQGRKIRVLDTWRRYKKDGTWRYRSPRLGDLIDVQSEFTRIASELNLGAFDFEGSDLDANH